MIVNVWTVRWFESGRTHIWIRLHPPASRSLPSDGNMAHPPHPSHPRRRPWILPNGTESEIHLWRPRTTHNPQRRPLLHPFRVIELRRSCGRILHLTASPHMRSSAAATRTASPSRPSPYSASRGTAAAAAAPRGGREEAGRGWWNLTPANSRRHLRLTPRQTSGRTGSRRNQRAKRENNAMHMTGPASVWNFV
jgi:hypothetical protein